MLTDDGMDGAIEHWKVRLQATIFDTEGNPLHKSVFSKQWFGQHYKWNYKEDHVQHEIKKT